MKNEWEIIDERELRRAARLIEDERYDEARQLLLIMNNEPARQLMMQIPEQRAVEPEAKVKPKAQQSAPDPEKARSSLIAILFMVGLMFFACIGIFNATRGTSRSQPTPRPYATSNPSIIFFSCMEQPMDEDCFSRSFMYDQCRAQGHDANYCSRQVNFMYPREP